jgi:hypothetical protein
MNSENFLQGLKNGEELQFQDTMAVIANNYRYQATRFRNGLQMPLESPAGTNEGSCKIFAFARLHGLTELETLQLFGDYYRVDVLMHPEGVDHQNIRTFMRDGWAGIEFSGEPLTPL